MRIWRDEDLDGYHHDPKEHDAVVLTIAKILRGRHPAAQGAILADLVGALFAGYPTDERRTDAIQLWTELTRQMIAMYEERIRRELGDEWPP